MTQQHALGVLVAHPSYLTVWAIGVELYVWASINVRLDTSLAWELVQLRQWLADHNAHLKDESLFSTPVMMGGKARMRIYALDRPPEGWLVA